MSSDTPAVTHGIEGLPSRLVFERVLQDAKGESQAFRVEVDLGAALECEIARLANRTRALKLGKCSSSAGGVIRVCRRTSSQEGRHVSR